MDKKIYLTKEGLEELKAEYEEISKKKRPEVVLRLAAARDQGDLSENAEYSAARDELSFIDGRIDELEELLRQVELIEEPKKGSKTVVMLGSTVTVHIGKKQEDFTVVGEWEADPAAKKISDQSPLGKALMGKAIGEKVEVAAPAGKILYTIISVK
ncbi:MAG TPA: transcription elongation factor GreA [Candidatus Saccharimonadales bacterium]|nr:transcription elongation factor GreA [Candidatus Saccharimonadales bacterium]